MNNLDKDYLALLQDILYNGVSLNIKIHTGVDEDHTLHKQLDVINIPTKLITITYKDEKIEVYE